MGGSSRQRSGPLTSIEICAGAGGQAIGLKQAGFRHLALVEIDKHAHATLKANIEREQGWDSCEVLPWDVVTEFKANRKMEAIGRKLKKGELDLLAGGVPCPPFSKAGQQLGESDERDLFPRMLKLVSELEPKAVMIENVRGIMDAKFENYRDSIVTELEDLGYRYCGWQLLEAHNYGVPQLRPRAVLIAIQEKICVDAELGDGKFPWPISMGDTQTTVFSALQGSMEDRRDVLVKKFSSRRGEIEQAYSDWLSTAAVRGGVAPTLVGGSRKHGGADLGPTRAKREWEALGVNALGVADDADNCTNLDRDFLRIQGPMLTVSQAARIQGFPVTWDFCGGKTARYRQVGNAFPPPVARAIGLVISSVLRPELKEELPEDLNIEYISPQRPGNAYFQTEIEGAVDMSASLVDPSPADGFRDLIGADV